TSFASVTDGLSNTVFVGEKHVQRGQIGNVKGDRTIWNGDSIDVFARVAGPGKGIVADLNTATNQRFGSYHPGVCQFLLGDGSVRGLKVTTRGSFLALLVGGAGGGVRPVTEPPGGGPAGPPLPPAPPAGPPPGSAGCGPA